MFAVILVWSRLRQTLILEAQLKYEHRTELCPLGRLMSFFFVNVFIRITSMVTFFRLKHLVLAVAYPKIAMVSHFVVNVAHANGPLIHRDTAFQFMCKHCVNL